MAFYQLEPYGDEWLRTGVLAATTANTSGNVKKKSKPVDFMPQFKTKQSNKKIGQILDAWKSIYSSR